MNCTGKRCIMQFDKVDPATCPCVSYCPQATPPKTKADLIRVMSDEELAEFLNSHNFCARNFDCEKGMRPCRECNLDWLKQEIEEDN